MGAACSVLRKGSSQVVEATDAYDNVAGDRKVTRRSPSTDVEADQ